MNNYHILFSLFFVILFPELLFGQFCFSKSHLNGKKVIAVSGEYSLVENQGVFYLNTPLYSKNIDTFETPIKNASDILYNRSNGSIFTATDSGLFKYSGNNQIWANIPSIPKVKILAIIESTGSYFDQLKMFFLRSEQEIYRTMDLGNTWETINIRKAIPDSLKDYSIACVYISPFNEKRIYVCIDEKQSKTLLMILKSEDKGDSWKPLKNSINTPMSHLLSLIEYEHQYVMISTKQGVFYTESDTSQWKIAPYNPGPDKRCKLAYYLHVYEDHELFAALTDSCLQAKMTVHVINGKVLEHCNDIGSVHPQSFFLGTDNGVYLLGIPMSINNNIHPKPTIDITQTNSYFKIENPEKMITAVEIYTIQGRLSKNISLSASNEFQMYYKTLTPMNYILKIRTKTGDEYFNFSSIR